MYNNIIRIKWINTLIYWRSLSQMQCNFLIYLVYIYFMKQNFSCFLTPGTACWLDPGRWSCWPAPLPPPVEGGWSASVASPGGRWCGWVLHRCVEVWWRVNHYVCCLALSRPEHLPWNWPETCYWTKTNITSAVRSHVKWRSCKMVKRLLLLTLCGWDWRLGWHCLTSQSLGCWESVSPHRILWAMGVESVAIQDRSPKTVHDISKIMLNIT